MSTGWILVVVAAPPDFTCTWGLDAASVANIKVRPADGSTPEQEFASSEGSGTAGANWLGVPLTFRLLAGDVPVDSVVVNPSPGIYCGLGMSASQIDAAKQANPGLVVFPLAITTAPVSQTILPDALIHSPPPLTPAPVVPVGIPAPGATYVDPVYGTRIMRVTDARNMTDATGSKPKLDWITNEYSTCCPFNQDGSLLLLLHESYFGLYTGAQGVFMGNLPFEISGGSEPRWSRRDLNTIYYHVGNQLKSYEVATRVTAVVRTFSEYASITGKGKTDISYDGDHFIFIGDSRELFIYQISTDTKTVILQNQSPAWNNVFISPDNNAVVSWLTAGTARYQGVEVYDGAGNFLRQITHADGHSKMTRDTNGDEVFVWTSSADPQPKFRQQSIVKVRIADGAQTQLLAYDWSLACHISACDKDWCFVETYAPGDPQPPSGWFPYTNELLAIKLDGTEIRRLAHHRSRPFPPGNTYNYMPKLSASRDGKRIAYGSNFGISAPLNYSDAYMIDL